MGDLGLPGAYGAAGAADALRQILTDRIAAQERARLAMEHDRDFNLRQQEFDQRTQEHNANMQSLADQRTAAAAENRLKLAQGVATSRDIGDSLTPDAVSTLKAGGLDLARHEDATLPSTQMGGWGSLPGGNAPVRGRLVAAASPSAPARDVYTGTAVQRTDAARKTGMLQLINSLPQGSRERSALEYEQLTGRSAPAGMFEPKAANPLPVHDTARGLMRPNAQGIMEPVLDVNGRPVMGYHPPTTPPADKLVKVEHRDPTTGRTVIEWLPQSDVRGRSFEKGASGATETRLASAEAVNQTGEDIIKQLRDPAFAAAVGPAMGRANTLRDFIGNPPPEYAELAGAIESYALANMGVHGMRSAQGAQQISRLLDQHHTPESLIAAINGLSKFSAHFMQNEGRTPAASPTPSGPKTNDPLGIR